MLAKQSIRLASFEPWYRNYQQINNQRLAAVSDALTPKTHPKSLPQPGTPPAATPRDQYSSDPLLDQFTWDETDLL